MSETASLFFYLISFIVSAFFINKWKQTENKIHLIIGLAIPTLIAAMRYYVGTDSVTYIQIFHRISKYNFSEILQAADSEGGFSLMIYIVNYLGGDIELFYGASAALVLIPAVAAFKKDYTNLSFGILWFLFLISNFTSSLNIMRQMVAISVVLFSARYIISRDIKRFAIAIIIAMSFHSSALAFAPIYFLYDKNRFLTLKRLLFIIALIVIVTSLSSFFDTFSEVDAISKYSTYMREDSRANNREFVLNVGLFLLFFFSRARMQATDSRTNFFLFLYFSALIFGATGFYTPFIKRVALYYTVFVIPLACIWMKGSNLRAIAIVSYFVLRFVVVSYILGQGNIIPYNTYDTFMKQNHISYNETTIPNTDSFGWWSRESAAQSCKKLA